jgi:hypothetical protein
VLQTNIMCKCAPTTTGVCPHTVTYQQLCANPLLLFDAPSAVFRYLHLVHRISHLCRYCCSNAPLLRVYLRVIDYFLTVSFDQMTRQMKATPIALRQQVCA